MTFFLQEIYKDIYMLAVCLLTALLITGCTSQQDEGEEGPVQMQFDVNRELLGDSVRVAAGNIGFSPPKNWQPLPDNIFEEASRHITQFDAEDDNFSIIPVYIFLHQQNGSALVVSKIIPENGNTFTGEPIHTFRSHVSDRFESEEIQEADFLKEDIHIYQYIIQKEDTVNFKLLFQNRDNKIFQFDYVVPHAVYLSESKAIESSIGSIHLY